MFGDILRPGDMVFGEVPQENISWGYRPWPKGATGTVVGFEETYYGRTRNFGYRPGVYENREWVKLSVNGLPRTEFAGFLKPTFGVEEEERRLSALREVWKVDPRWRGEYLRDLPETPFWEEDIVRRAGAPGMFRIFKIDYPKRVYSITDSAGEDYVLAMREEDLVLEARGPVWRYFHNNAVCFLDIREEAEFFDVLGHTEDVRNPSSRDYGWTLREVLAAIRDGSVHGFKVSGGAIRAMRYRDETLGKRVAKATLEGFQL